MCIYRHVKFSMMMDTCGMLSKILFFKQANIMAKFSIYIHTFIYSRQIPELNKQREPIAINLDPRRCFLHIHYSQFDHGKLTFVFPGTYILPQSHCTSVVVDSFFNIKVDVDIISTITRFHMKIY